MSLLRILKSTPIATCLLLVAVASAVFLVFPGIDLWFSDLFYRSRAGSGCAQRCARLPPCYQRRADGPLTFALIASLVVKLVRPERPSPAAPEHGRLPASTMVLGSAAPRQRHPQEHLGPTASGEVDAFGGDAPYVEVWRITGWCADNCSFVSGEASSAIWLVAVALVLPKSVRGPATVVAIVYALLLSLNRIAFGGHFLSDVVISFGLTLLLIAVVHRVVIERPPKWLSNAVLEGGLTRLGRAMRGERSHAGTV